MLETPDTEGRGAHEGCAVPPSPPPRHKLCDSSLQTSALVFLHSVP